MSVSYKLGGLIYRTKSSVISRCRRLLREEKTLEENDFLFVRDLVSFHPFSAEKIGVGIVSIEVRRSRSGTNCFYMVRVDQTSEDFSFMKCLRWSPSFDARQAFREEIRDQVQLFKKFVLSSAGAKCAITGETVTRENAHVDHASPLTFTRLLDDFLGRESISISSVETTKETDEVPRLLADRNLAARWQNYHQLKARLRITTSFANLSILRRSPERTQ